MESFTTLKEAAAIFLNRLASEKADENILLRPDFHELLIKSTKQIEELANYLEKVEEEKSKKNFQKFCTDQYIEFKSKYHFLIGNNDVCTVFGLKNYKASTQDFTIIEEALGDIKLLINLFASYERKYKDDGLYELPTDLDKIHTKLLAALTSVAAASINSNTVIKVSHDIEPMLINIDLKDNLEASTITYSIEVPATYSKEQLKTVIDTLVPVGTDIKL